MILSSDHALFHKHGTLCLCLSHCLAAYANLGESAQMQGMDVDEDAGEFLDS